MSLSDVERTILDLATEDSFALSEVVARVRAVADLPAATDARALARSAVRTMLDAGLIEITRLDSPTGNESRLDRVDAERALNDDLIWLEPRSWRPHLRVTATSLGRRKYFETDVSGGGQ